MTKAALRKQYIERRQILTQKETLVNNDLLLIRFQQFALPPIEFLLTYWPMLERGEVDMHLMADYLSFRVPALKLAFPVMMMASRQLKACLVDDETEFVENIYGVMEPVGGEELSPVMLDAVFVPLLAYDEQGYRVGYGKGFYDRFLKSCRADVMKIGFSFFEPEPAIEDVNDFDVPLNLCITPNKIYEF